MSVLPQDIDTGQQSSLTLLLRHFFVALGFLLVGMLVGLGTLVGIDPGLDRLAHVHLLLVGWVCLTIMGAMTQFVPVWSGVDLHSRRLASIQLVLVTGGLLGFAAAFLLGTFAWLAPFGLALVVGFWVFVYNIARTMADVETYDVTLRHFLFALGSFLVLTALGLWLALVLGWPDHLPAWATRYDLLGAHVTLAVFGAVLTTIYGAMYQLGTMFTQTELHGIDHPLQTAGEVAHYAGVVALAVGRIFEISILSGGGGLAIVLGALAFATIIGRKLYEMQVDWTPMHSRYTVVVPALVVWALATVPTWLEGPTGRVSLYGAEGTGHLLLLGVVGFVILGTLYHIIPFIIWIDQYSDRLGLEDVPMIDDLYDDRLAAVDFWLLVVGTALLVLSDTLVSESLLALLGGVLLTLGVVLFTANMVLVVRGHSPYRMDQVLLGRLSPRSVHEDSTVTK